MSADDIYKRIITASAEAHGVGVSDIMGPYRTRPVARARQVAMVVALRKVPHASQSSVARHFVRDHTTVHHAVKAVSERANACPSTASIVGIVEGAADYGLQLWAAPERDGV